MKRRLGIFALLFTGLLSTPSPGREFDSDINLNKARYLVTDLYRAALFRHPTSSELSSQSYRVERKGYQELIRVAAEIGKTKEFLYIAYQYPHYEIIESLYRGLLLRASDPSGMRYWLKVMQLQEYDRVVGGFVGSSEYYSLHIHP